MSHKAHTIKCRPLIHEFYHLTVQCPALTKQALPGHYVLYQQNPLYILATAPDQLEFILPQPLANALLNSSSIFFSDLRGCPFQHPQPEVFYLMLLEDQALSAGLFYLRKYRAQFKGLVFIGAQQYFPFQPCPSQKMIPGIPPDTIAALPLLEEWGIASRLASGQEQPGVFYGTVHGLAKIWLSHAQSLQLFSKIEILTVQQ